MQNRMNMKNKTHKYVPRNSQINLYAQEFDYPDFHLSMDCFWCELQSEHVVLNEHEDAKWLSKSQLDSVDWLPADVTLVDKIAKGM